jgi:hypothetical protein
MRERSDCYTKETGRPVTKDSHCNPRAAKILGTDIILPVYFVRTIDQCSLILRGRMNAGVGMQRSFLNQIPYPTCSTQPQKVLINNFGQTIPIGLGMALGQSVESTLYI